MFQVVPSQLLAKLESVGRKKPPLLAWPQAGGGMYMRALEPRILLDAAAMETVADTVSAAVHANLADTYVAKNSVNLDVNFAPTEGLANSIGPVFDADAEFDHVQETSQTAIAFISADVPNVVKLVSALSPETEVVLLDATSDGIEQIADFLDGRTDIDAIHLISHGAEGSLSLGNAQLNSETMSENYRQQLSQIGNALSEDGDILIYGCNFGSGVIGNRAAQVLAEITGADVAASTDLTGSAELGGDWVLESRTGSIEADTIDAEEHWFGVLPTAIIESHEVPLNEIDHDEKTGGNTIIGQNFSHSSAEAQYEVVQIDLVLGLKDNPAVQNVIVTIRESPTGPILASGTIQSTELSTTADWHSVTLDAGVLLNSGDNYVFMIGTDSHTGESSITVGVEHDSSYAGGEAVDKNGNDRSDHYTLFRMHGTVNSSPTITSNGGGAWVFPSVDENQTFVTTVEATDADVPGDTLSYSITGGADASKFTIDPVSGDLSFLVAPDYENPTDAFPFNGIYSVVVEVSDGRGGTDSQTLSVVVEDIDEINDAPVATAGDVSTSEDVPVDGSIVMSDPDVGDVLQATLGTDATNGSVIVNLDGTFTYTPDANYAGPDNFTIVVTDQDGLSDTVTVNVTVAPFNDAPVGTTAPLSTLEDNQVSGTITMTDPDAGDMVQASLVTVPANGQAIVNPDGTFTYTPNAEFSGDDSFTAMVTDSDGLFDTVTVNVTVSPVNDAPRAYDDSVNVMENTATALALTVPTDVDDADANLTITINQVPSPAQGTLTYIQDGGGTANVGIGSTLSKNELTTLVFTPAPSYSGSVDDIVYTVTDDDNFSDLTSVATVNLTINGVNDAPDAYNNSVNVTEDTVTAISPTVPTDVDNVATDLTVTVNQVPPSNQGTFSYTLDIGGSANVTVGTTMSIAEFASLTFSPVQDYAGTVGTFAYRVTDLAGVSDAGSDGSISVTMIGQDDAPEGHASAITLPEDVQASGSIVMSDPDIGDTLQATLGTGPLNGSAAVNLDGTFTYMPNANFSGTDSFTIVVTDTSGLTDIVTVNLMVTPFNDAPSGTAPTVTTPEETAINGTVTMTDPDIGDVVQATLGTTPSYGTASVNLDGTYTYTPDTDFAGDDSFTVIVTDNAGLSDTVIVNVTVSPVDDAPVGTAPAIATPEDQQVSGTISMVDPDTGDTPEASLATGPANGTAIVNPDGTFTYTPTTNFAGLDSFTVDITDDTGLTDTVTVNVTVAAVDDDAPVGTAAPIVTNEDNAVGGAVTMTDPDAGDTPSASLGAGPTHGTAVINADGSFTYTPNADYAGSDSFTVVITDDTGLTDSVEVDVTVVAVNNDAPMGTVPLVQTTEQTAVNGSVVMTDPDFGDSPEASLGTGPTNGFATVNPDGTFSYTPTTNYVGTDSFTIVVTDDTGLTDTVTVNVTIDAAESLPRVAETIEPTEPEATPAPDTPVTPSEPVTTELEPIVEEIPVTTSGPQLPEAPPPPQPASVAVAPVIPTAPQPNVTAPVDEPEPEPAPAPEPVQDFEPIAAENLISIKEPATLVHETTQRAATNYELKPIEKSVFSNDLKRSTDDVRNYKEFFGTAAANVTFAFSSILSVGGASFVLRSGVVAAALMSAVPAWGRFDPISIVTGRKDDCDDNEPSDAEMMLEFVQDARNRVVTTGSE